MANTEHRESFREAPGGGAKRPYLPYLHDFRGFAIILVVLSHLDSNALPLGYFHVIQNATVFFIFLAGFFFRYLHREEESAVDFWKRKTMRVVIPYLIALVPGVFIYWLAGRTEFTLAYVFRTALTGIGHINDPHWFVPFIVLIFFAYPAWTFLIKRPKALVYCMTISLLISMFTFRSESNSNPLISLIHFTGIFVTGMFAAAHHEIMISICRRYFGWVLFLGFGGWAATLPFLAENWKLNMEHVWRERILMWDLMLIGKLCLVFPFIAIFDRLAALKRRPALLKHLAQMSFGIFAWHMYAIVLFNKLGTLLVPHEPIWMVVLQTIMVFISVIGVLQFIKNYLPRLAPYFGVE